MRDSTVLAAVIASFLALAAAAIGSAALGG